MLVAMEKYGQKQMESIHEGYRYARRELGEVSPKLLQFPSKVGECRTSAKITTTKWMHSAIPMLNRLIVSEITDKHRWTMCNNTWTITMPKYVASLHSNAPHIFIDNTIARIRFTTSGANLGIL